MTLKSISNQVIDEVRGELPANTRRSVKLEFEIDQLLLTRTVNQIKEDIIDPVEVSSIITTMVSRVIKECFSSSNRKRLIQIETTRKVEKLMETESFGSIISNHLLQLLGLLNPLTEHMEKAVDKSIE